MTPILFMRCLLRPKRESSSLHICTVKVLDPFWADRTVLHKDRVVAIKFVSPVKLKMGLSHAFKKPLLQHVSHFEKLGMDFKQETTGDMLTPMDSDGAFSALSAA